MIMTIAAKKGKGLDDLLQGYSSPSLDENKKMIVSPGGGTAYVEAVMQKYQEALEVYQKTVIRWADMDYSQEFAQYLKNLKDTLTPHEINAFFTTGTIFEERGWYFYNTFGKFISVLLQNSYNAGHNNFMLNTSVLHKSLFELATELVGSKDNPLVLTICGNVGGYFADQSQWLECQIYGPVNINFAIITKDCIFTLHGKNQNYINFQAGQWTNRSTFKADHQETIDILLRDVPRGNKIIFIRNDGSQQIVRDYQ